MKFTFNSSSLETDFSELKDLVGFLDSIKKRETSIKEAQHGQEEFNKYLKIIRIGNKSEKQQKKHCLLLISFLTEETMLSNL